jgi:hypothetical protein
MKDVWRAIERLAEVHGLSCSGLAKKAGLDETTFNKSKRIDPKGRQRWPSTESIHKILLATNERMESFVTMAYETKPSIRAIFHSHGDHIIKLRPSKTDEVFSYALNDEQNAAVVTASLRTNGEVEINNLSIDRYARPRIGSLWVVAPAGRLIVVF